jgi:SynChlorMet cassette protein ScmC
MRLTQTGTERGDRLTFVSASQRNGEVRQAVPEVEGSATSAFEEQAWSLRDLKPVRIWSTNGTSEKVIEVPFLGNKELEIISMLFSLIPVHHAVISNGGLPFHAALVTKNGSGLLLAGPGDRGKSTCAARIPRPWEALCDDEAMIVREKNGQYAVHPFPTWSDHMSGRSHKTWDVQRYVPLRAIFFLEQSEDDKIVEISKSQAATRSYRAAEQVSGQNWRGLDPAEVREFRNKLFENACNLIKEVPAYVLRVSLAGRFWEEMEKVLS